MKLTYQKALSAVCFGMAFLALGVTVLLVSKFGISIKSLYIVPNIILLTMLGFFWTRQ